MSYTLTQYPNLIVRDEDGAHIPEDLGNIDWIAYQAWLAEGNIPNPYVAAPPTRQQEVDAYLAAGLYINAPTGTMGSGRFSMISPYIDRIRSNATYYNSNGDFPGNLPYAEIFDMDGMMHSITGGHKGQWSAFTSAVGDFTHNCNLYVEGFIDALPPNEVTIASVVEIDNG